MIDQVDYSLVFQELGLNPIWKEKKFGTNTEDYGWEVKETVTRIAPKFELEPQIKQTNRDNFCSFLYLALVQGVSY